MMFIPSKPQQNLNYKNQTNKFINTFFLSLPEQEREIANFSLQVSKIKTILPSLKEKKRYISFEVVSDNNFSFNEIKKEINKHILKILGEKGYSKAGIMFIDTNTKNQGIIKTNNKELINTRAALTLINEINNKKLIIKCRKVSGILKKAKNSL